MRRQGSPARGKSYKVASGGTGTESGVSGAKNWILYQTRALQGPLRRVSRGRRHKESTHKGYNALATLLEGTVDGSDA